MTLEYKPSETQDPLVLGARSATPGPEEGLGVCVVYLAWGPLGLDPVRAFAESYRVHPAGYPHELVIALNNVEDDDCEEIERILEGISHGRVRLQNPVLDLEAYRLVTLDIAADAYCFLNTYSRLLSSNWLERYVAALAVPDVGVAAAGASYRSMREFNPSRVGPVSLPLIKRALLWQSTVRRARRFRREFAGSPCPFVRSNGFAMRASTIDRIGWPKCKSKFDTWRFESGKRGLTARTQGAGLRCVVVDTEGRVFDVSDWPESRTFWSHGQDRLLVADNRSDEYAKAAEADRPKLAYENWPGHGFGTGVPTGPHSGLAHAEP